MSFKITKRTIKKGHVLLGAKEAKGGGNHEMVRVVEKGGISRRNKDKGQIP